MCVWFFLCLWLCPSPACESARRGKGGWREGGVCGCGVRPHPPQRVDMIETQADVKPSQMDFEWRSRETKPALSDHVVPLLVLTDRRRASLWELVCVCVCFRAVVRLCMCMCWRAWRWPTGPVTSRAPAPLVGACWAYGLELQRCRRARVACAPVPPLWGATEQGVRAWCDARCASRVPDAPPRRDSRYAYPVCAPAPSGP